MKMRLHWSVTFDMQTPHPSHHTAAGHAGAQSTSGRLPQETQPESPDMRPVIPGRIYRPNLHYRVIATTSEAEKLSETVKLVHATQGAGIVYAATTKAVETVCRALEAAGERVTVYHRQLPAKARSHNQQAFLNGASRVLVATSAFGTAIEKHDIRFVIHYQIPASPEAYCLETGLAGRDGAPVECTLLYYRKDKQVQQFFLARRYPAADDLGAVYAALQVHAADNAGVSPARLQETLEPVSDNRLLVALRLLTDAGLIEQDEHHHYRVTRLRAKPKELAALVDAYQDRAARDHEALECMVSYAQTGFCRWKTLLQYVGEQVEWSRCGVCDNCLQPPEQALSPEHVRQAVPVTKHEGRRPLPEIGSAVRVARFGEGRVVACVGDKVTIAFPDKQIRTFLRDYVEPA